MKSHPPPPLHPFFFFPNLPPLALPEAWDLFALLALFAILFNLFYPYGIELRPQRAKKLHLQEIVRSRTEPSYAGWGKTTKPAPKAKATPQPAPQETVTRVSLQGAKDRFDRKAAVFLDARKPEEYREGHIPGAINFPTMEMNKFAPVVLPQLTDRNRETIVYCNGGDCTLSLELAEALKEQGYIRMEVYEGGWPAWKKAGYPAHTGDAP